MSDVNTILQEATGSYNKSEVPLLGLQKAFDKEFGAAQDQWNFDHDGFPAWNQLLTIPISGSFSQYLVPVFKGEDDRVKALILFTHYLDHGIVDVEYVYRGKVNRYPAYNSLRLANKNGITPLRDHTVESLVVKFSVLDQQLFGNTYDDLLLLLDEDVRNQFYSKDCQITTRYLVLECQDVVGGGELLYTDCNAVGVETIVTVIAGCDGGTGSPGNPGPSGPTTGGSGTGGGVSVVNTDPGSRDNRCIEDGVDCDEDDDKEEEIRIDTILTRTLPCAASVIQEFVFQNRGDFSDRINDFFNNPNKPNINLTLTAGYTGTNHAVTNAPTAGGGNGDIYVLDAIITMNNAHPSNDRMNKCSKDMILSTVVHELIHTEILYLYTRDGYVAYSNSGGGFNFITDVSDYSQHELMAMSRVEFIADILIASNSNLANEYENTGVSVAYLLSWVGLTDTDGFQNALTNLPADILDAIEEVAAAADCRESSSVINNFGFNMCPNGN